MNILIESSNADYNWGDASMLVVAVQRLRRHFPTAQITPLRPHQAFRLTKIETRLQSFPEGPRGTWFSQRPIWRKAQEKNPLLVDWAYALLPELMEEIGGLKMRALGYDVKERDAFLALFDQADALVVTAPRGRDADVGAAPFALAAPSAGAAEGAGTPAQLRAIRNREAGSAPSGGLK